jgi:hypothetical protein
MFLVKCNEKMAHDSAFFRDVDKEENLIDVGQHDDDFE